MTDKSLKKQAINIKGKDYVLVSDRVRFFNENYPDGCIKTDLVSEWDSQYIVVKASVYPNITKSPDLCFNGYSQATIGDGMVNKTAALENAETSAVGRALGMMGIGVIESIASFDEMAKTTHTKTATRRRASLKQVELLVNKVKWGLKVYDQDEIVNILDNAIGKSITELYADEVDEAIKKVDAAVRKDKVMVVAETKSPAVEDQVVDIPADFDVEKELANLPY